MLCLCAQIDCSFLISKHNVINDRIENNLGVKWFASSSKMCISGIEMN